MLIDKDVSRKWTLGLIMLTIVIILWVMSSFLINLIFEDNIYRKPFFITYINTASFIFYLIPTFKNTVRKYFRDKHWSIHKELILQEEGVLDDSMVDENNNNINNTSGTEVVRRVSINSSNSTYVVRNSSSNSNLNSSVSAAVRSRNGSFNAAETTQLLLQRNSVSSIVSIRLSLRDTTKLSAQFCVLWFLANFATNASLAYTSVASQTMLSSTSSFFTLFIGALGNVETVTKPKVIGSILSFLGIALVTQSDSLQRRLPIKPTGHMPPTEPITDLTSWQTMMGNLLAVAGAMFYGIYSTLLKIKVQDESMINMKIFFGFVGLFTLLFMWPSLIILHYMGWETFVLPTQPKVIVIILINMVITFVSDFCWAKAMLLTSPLTVTVGLSITIPVAMFGDILFKHKNMPLEYMLGGLLILGSFVIISKNTEAEEEGDIQTIYESQSNSIDEN
ncbi:similar to Saccharomyces cerevisiae YDR438W THI74 Mitochondrial transporter repressible by thiamine [Maudiozyma saulgeensis]|uniref:Similar to Saccharomyces cerevisiae YDR438W THI74 Mitochondrial transporter repressible by thiamine n=1 Tax=Maudiozyma saulgeensis TaxID=1789683 RepID=A0A1X7QXQ4_9SACH|nr:similar to Saccharomyces cerevisiae YDR438W THI74 Mitochondrial transporter repressible by thiamine [Kazachstania saulgeensis]